LQYPRSIDKSPAKMTKTKCYVIGVGMTKFEKPGKRDWDYPDMVKEAVNKALDDCKLKYEDIQQATVSYLFGGTCCGQRALYEIGFTGIPIYNVNNACASGSSGVFLCKQILESGNADVVMACGFEKMASGSLENMAGATDDRALSVDHHIEVMANTHGLQPAPITAQMFGMAALDHMKKYGTKREHFAKIAHKNHLHSIHNENSQFQKEFSLDEVINARKIYDFMGLLECSPTSDGSAAAIICSENYLKKHPELRKQAVEIVGMQMGTDLPSVFKEDNIKMIGYDMIERISKNLYKDTGYGPNDIQVIEMHDCFAPNELITYEAIGLCPLGKGGELVDRKDNTYGGKWVINPSGGLISKGHPIGATGVAQVVELSNQLRGRCGKRQVPNAKLAMQHNIGIGGAGVVGLYKLADGAAAGGASISKAPAAAGGALKSCAVFQEIKERVNTEKDLVKKAGNLVARFIVTGDNGVTTNWLVDLKQNPPFVGHNDSVKAELDVTLSDEAFMNLAAGKIKPDQAFMKGQIKVKGNIAKAMKLQTILNPSMLKLKL
ncbi:hypothetical protein PFISCL1PPCAC_7420, partial [Pristionchus fissidentatus]